MKGLQPNDLCRSFKLILAFGSICTLCVYLRLKNTSDEVSDQQRRMLKPHHREESPTKSTNTGNILHENTTNGVLTFQNKTKGKLDAINVHSPPEDEIHPMLARGEAQPEIVTNYRDKLTADTRFNKSQLSSLSARNPVLVFSVPPKCGSRTLLLVAMSLTKAGNNDSFREITTLVDFKIVEKGSIQQKFNYINSAIAQADTPAFLYTHAYYIPYEKELGMDLNHEIDKTVIRISIIRDPFERKVSHYYYSRFRDSEPETKEELVWRNSLKTINTESYDECVRRGRPECVAELFQVRLITQFCGYEKGCKKANRVSLERAKENVKNHFLIVGIMEEYEEFIKLLEKMLPELFKGSIEQYKQVMKSERESSMKTTNKIKPENSTIDKVKHLMRYDYEFYNFIKERFQEQKKKYL
ncbi:heparan sulfate 2-O-sulfotransferase 1-like [Apostichopus japonicus]